MTWNPNVVMELLRLPTVSGTLPGKRSQATSMLHVPRLFAALCKVSLSLSEAYLPYVTPPSLHPCISGLTSRFSQSCACLCLLSLSLSLILPPPLSVSLSLSLPLSLPLPPSPPPSLPVPRIRFLRQSAFVFSHGSVCSSPKALDDWIIPPACSRGFLLDHGCNQEGMGGEGGGGG